MEFGLSEIQIALQDSINGFLEENCSLDTVRKFSDDPKTISKEIWRGFAELGLAGALVPEKFGGSGLRILDAVVISECIGAHVVPAPFLSTGVFAPRAFADLGTEQQQAEYLGDIASGNVRFGLALAELTGVRGTTRVSCTKGKLSGHTLFVTDPDADRFIVAAQGGNLFVVDAKANGLSLKHMPNVDRTRHLGCLEFDQVIALPLNGMEKEDQVTNLIDLARVVLAADTLGASQSMLDQSVAYAQQRKQFNRVIASFQAVKHMCAEMAAEIEPSRSLLWYAGHALDERLPDAHLTACHTKAHLSEVGTLVARTATVVHGGMGFTDLLGLHYWFKRIGFNRQIFGGPEVLREDAARAQGLVA